MINLLSRKNIDNGIIKSRGDSSMDEDKIVLFADTSYNEVRLKVNKFLITLYCVICTAGK